MSSKLRQEILEKVKELYKLEHDNRESLKRAIAKEIGDNIINYIIEQSKKYSDKILLLYRTGAIHPILKVHLLMDAFENNDVPKAAAIDDIDSFLDGLHRQFIQ